MPEENKYTTTEKELTESSVDAECTRSDTTDAEPLTETAASFDAISEDIPADSAGEDISADDTPLARISEDGDQLTLVIPSQTDPTDNFDDSISEPSDDSEDFATSLLKEAPTYNEKKPRRIDGRFDFVELLIFTLAAVFVLTSFVFRHSIVDGDSMQNTLQDGEILIISGLFYTPERYDIVVLEDRSTGLDHPIVKRVIATEGETVKITSDGKITVDGEEILDYFVFIDNGKEDKTYSPMEYTVPEGEIFVLGDHRNDSYDSRRFGGVDADAVLGKVLFRLYPFDRFGSVYGGAEE